MEIMFSISFRQYGNAKKKIDLFTLIIKMQILFAHAIITSTACASFCVLSGYINTVLNQSACVFALGYFQNVIKEIDWN